MTTNCCGNAVPPVPERPIDLTQPAYVLVDGHWVLLSEVIGGNQPADADAVLQIKHVSIPTSAWPLNTNSLTQIGSTVEIVPKSATSKLVVLASTSVQWLGNSGTTSPLLVYLGARAESSTGVYPAGTAWMNKGVAELDVILRQTIKGMTFQTEFAAAERRTDTGSWAIGLWYSQNQAMNVSLTTDPQLTFIEYAV